MVETSTVYRAIDSVLSTRERADRVLNFCFEGDVSRARRLVIPEDDADSLLAQGVVTYWLARTETQFTYDSAKDLLSRSARLFLENGDYDRSLLADIWVGLCYWRQGQLNEALILLTQSSAASDPRVRFIALVNRSVLHTEHQQWRIGLEVLKGAEIVFDAEPSLSWRGKFFQQRGLCYKQGFDETQNPEYLNSSLIHYDAANEHYERAGNLRFEAAISNNVANLYRLAKHFKKAHINADRAMVLYERIGDRSNLAQAKDTKALILLDENHLVHARRYADQAVALLKNHDPAWVTIPLVTRAKILCRMGFCSASQRDFLEAIRVAESTDNHTTAAEIYLAQAETLTSYLSVNALSNIFARINELSPSRLTAVASRALRIASAPEVHSLKDLKCAEAKSEYQMILRALEDTSGSVTAAAKMLGKTRGGLAHIIKTRHPELLKRCRDARTAKSLVR